MVASALPTAPVLRPSFLPILVGVNSWPGRSASQPWTRLRSAPGRSRWPLDQAASGEPFTVASASPGSAVPATGTSSALSA